MKGATDGEEDRIRHTHAVRGCPVDLEKSGSQRRPRLGCGESHRCCSYRAAARSRSLNFTDGALRWACPGSLAAVPDSGPSAHRSNHGAVRSRRLTRGDEWSNTTAEPATERRRMARVDRRLAAGAVDRVGWDGGGCGPGPAAQGSYRAASDCGGGPTSGGPTIIIDRDPPLPPVPSLTCRR